MADTSQIKEHMDVTTVNASARIDARCRYAYHLGGSGGFRCIRPQMCNLNAPCRNSPDGARSPKTRDRRRRHGGGGRCSRSLARRNRCRRRGVLVWNCLTTPPTPRVRQFFSMRSPARRRCPGPANFRARQDIRVLAKLLHFSVLAAELSSRARRLLQAEAAEILAEARSEAVLPTVGMALAC